MMDFKNLSAKILDNSENFLKISIGILCILLIVILIKWLLKKVQLNTFLLSLIYPRPVFGDLITKLINKIIKNDLVEGALSLKALLYQRFGTMSSVPIVLDVYENVQIKSLGDNCEFFSNPEISWLLNNKICIISLKQEQLKTVIPVLFHVFEGQIFQGLVIHFSDINKKITSICDLIFSITKTTIPVTLVHDSEKMELQSFHDLFKSEEAVGFEIKNPNDFCFSFEEFVYQNISRAVHSTTLINTYFPADLINLYNLEPIIQETFNQVLNSELIPRGVFFVCFNKLELRDQVLFCEDLFCKIVYSFCNESRTLDKYNNVKKNNLFKFLFYASVASSLLLGFWLFRATNRRIDHIKTSIQVTKNAIDKKFVDELKILEHVKNTNADKIGYLSKFLASQEVADIKHVRNFLITVSSRVFGKIDNVESEEIFSFSPVDTQLFQKLDYNVRTLSESLTELMLFVQSENNYNLLDQKITQYTELCKTKIITNITNFCNYFNRYILIEEARLLSKSIQDLFQNPSLAQIEEVLDKMKKIKTLCKSSANTWWIREELEVPFKKMMKTVENIAGAGEIINGEVRFMVENSIKKVKDTLLDREGAYVGKFFIIENANVRFSDRLQKFFDDCSLLLQEPVLQLSIGLMEYTLPEKNEVTLWDLDALDKILQKLEMREDFLKNISGYPQEVKKLAIGIMHQNLYEYIKSGLCDAQKILTAEISIEEKAKNCRDSWPKINKIKAFMVKTLGKTMPSFVDFFISDTVLKICDEYKQIVANSIFTLYNRLLDWQGEDLVLFLFQCKNEDLASSVIKNMERLQGLNNDVLIHIMEKLPEVSASMFKEIRYFFDQVNFYAHGQKNAIASFENFLNELPKWEIKWRSSSVAVSSKDAFFTFHEKFFKKILIQQTNKVFFEKSKKYYNELVSFFHTNLAGRFPFGNFEPVNDADLLKFLKMYKSYREHLKSDADFAKLDLKVSLGYLDRLCAFFSTDNDILTMNAKIQYHLPEGQNQYLIKTYFSKFGDDVLRGDSIENHGKALSGFSMGLEIINSSKFKLKVRDELEAKLQTYIKFAYLEEYGFLKFIKTFLYCINETNALLKITIPLSTEDGRESQDLVCVIRIYDYPYFFDEMESI